MTVPITPGPGPEINPAPAVPVPVVKKRPAWLIPVLAGVVLVALCCGGVFIAALAKPSSTSGSSTPGGGDTGTVQPAVDTVTTPARKVYTPPTAADFVLTVKVLKQSCFGSAGCNVTYSIDVGYSGAELEPGKKWDVTYTVAGGDEPKINTFQLYRGDSATSFVVYGARDEFISTPPGPTLTATVTSISAH